MVISGGPATGLLGRETTKKQQAVTHGPTSLVLPRYSKVPSTHLLIQIYHHGGGRKKTKNISKRTITQPLPSSESCTMLEEQIGEDKQRSRG